MKINPLYSVSSCPPPLGHLLPFVLLASSPPLPFGAGLLAGHHEAGGLHHVKKDVAHGIGRRAPGELQTAAEPGGICGGAKVVCLRDDW